MWKPTCANDISKLIAWLITLLFCLSSRLGFCQETDGSTSPKIKIYAYDLAHRLTATEDTQYRQLLSHFEKKGLEFELSIQPLLRASRNFVRESSSCVFPASVSALNLSAPKTKTIELIASNPIDFVSMKIYHLADKNPFQRSVGKIKIASQHAISLDNFKFPRSYEFIPTPSEEVRLTMLKAGRVDAAIGFFPDTLLIIDKMDLGFSISTLDLDVIAPTPTSFVCKNNVIGRKFINTVNTFIDTARNNGNLKRILGHHANITGSAPMPKSE